MAASTDNQPDNPASPWYSAYPAVKGDVKGLSRDAVLELLHTEGAGTAFVLVDVRRADHEGGTIRGSINLPAQSLFPTIPTLYALFKAAGAKKVIWYCGSSKGRGTRAAGWFGDHLDERRDEEMESLILEGGIKGWAKAGDRFVEMMDEYDEAVWEKFE
ncbi:arsenate reductase [Schizothecium vesticola]|uniref:Arsenate reductase n=1 Tax=Schizothecium vesticola TaxID=314040 RepID=A0AA40F2G6_9PEZI|nr:arsenate reductase [Schizothecium vesticola]